MELKIISPKVSVSPQTTADDVAQIAGETCRANGTLRPSFSGWLVDGTKPTRMARLLKEKMLPLIYWRAMLRGKEWMAKPEKLTVSTDEIATIPFGPPVGQRDPALDK